MKKIFLLFISITICIFAQDRKRLYYYLSSDDAYDFSKAGTLVYDIDFEATTRITKDANNKVTNYLYAGVNLAQADTSKSPTLTTSGFYSDGVNDLMTSGAITVNQPRTIFIVNIPLNDGYLFDGSAALRSSIFTSGASNWFGINAGTALSEGATNMAYDGTTHIVVGMFNGASSSIQVDNNAVVTGNAGAGQITAINVFSRLGAVPFKGYIKRILIYSGDLGTAKITEVINELNKIYEAF